MNSCPCKTGKPDYMPQETICQFQLLVKSVFFNDQVRALRTPYRGTNKRWCAPYKSHHKIGRSQPFSAASKWGLKKKKSQLFLFQKEYYFNQSSVTLLLIQKCTIINSGLCVSPSKENLQSVLLCQVSTIIMSWYQQDALQVHGFRGGAASYQQNICSILGAKVLAHHHNCIVRGPQANQEPVVHFVRNKSVLVTVTTPSRTPILPAPLKPCQPPRIACSRGL